MVEDGYDAMVITGEAKDPRLMTHVLGSYHLQIVGSPTYFVQYGLPLVPTDLLRHSCPHHVHRATGKLQR